MKAVLIAFLASLWLCQSAMAAGKPVECIGEQTQSTWRECADAKLQKAILQMDGHYSGALHYLLFTFHTNSGDLVNQSREFVAAQQHWLKYRDLNCKAEGLSQWGSSLEFTIEQACLLRLTLQRAADLKRVYLN